MLRLFVVTCARQGFASRTSSKNILPTLCQQQRHFETDLELFNPSNTREIDKTKLEPSRFQDHLFKPDVLDFSPDFEKLMYHKRLEART